MVLFYAQSLRVAVRAICYEDIAFMSALNHASEGDDGNVRCPSGGSQHQNQSKIRVDRRFDEPVHPTPSEGP